MGKSLELSITLIWSANTAVDILIGVESAGAGFRQQYGDDDIPTVAKMEPRQKRNGQQTIKIAANGHLLEFDGRGKNVN